LRWRRLCQSFFGAERANPQSCQEDLTATTRYSFLCQMKDTGLAGVPSQQTDILSQIKDAIFPGAQYSAKRKNNSKTLDEYLRTSCRVGCGCVSVACQAVFLRCSRRRRFCQSTIDSRGRSQARSKLPSRGAQRTCKTCSAPLSLHSPFPKASLSLHSSPLLP